MLVVIFLAFFGIMMSRIFYLQIINGQNYADSFTMRIKREVSLPGTRGRIFDRNGQVLADNVLSYSHCFALRQMFMVTAVLMI
mgnify:CR=1 FL=1